MKQEPGDGASVPPRPALRFKPRVPPKKSAKIVVPKKEPVDTKDGIIDKELLEKLRTLKSKDGKKPKVENKVSPTPVVFGQRISSVARSFPVPKKVDDEVAPKEVVKEYVEPWDYDNCDYPTILPLRMPFSGNPDLLDEEEFGPLSAGQRIVKPRLTAAEELGLLETSNEPNLLFFQLPASLPIASQPSTDGSVGAGNKSDLPGGFIGKIIVYRSGKVKMKVGDALFDVTPGADCSFSQDAALIVAEEGRCVRLGPIGKTAIVTPDIDYMLDQMHK